MIVINNTYEEIRFDEDTNVYYRIGTVWYRNEFGNWIKETFERIEYLENKYAECLKQL